MKKGLIILAFVLLLSGLFFFYEYRLLQDLSYKVDSTQVQKLSWNQATVQINLNIHNPTDFNVNVDAINGDLFLNNVKIGSVNTPAPAIIDSKNDSIVPLVVSIDPKEIHDTNTMATILNSPLQFNGVGNIKVGAFRVKSLNITFSTTINNLLNQ